MGGQTAQGMYEITLREEFAKMNELTGSNTLSLRVQARVSDNCLLNSLEGPVVWECDPMVCPQMTVQQYKGLMIVYTNQMNIYEGSSAVVEHKEKEQAAGLEIAESFILCGHLAYNMHIKNIAIFIHNADRVKVAKGQFTNKGSNLEMTDLRSGMSFLQFKSS
jgi:hypothetical protein